MGHRMNATKVEIRTSQATMFCNSGATRKSIALRRMVIGAVLHCLIIEIFEIHKVYGFKGSNYPLNLNLTIFQEEKQILTVMKGNSLFLLLFLQCKVSFRLSTVTILQIAPKL